MTDGAPTQNVRDAAIQNARHAARSGYRDGLGLAAIAFALVDVAAALRHNPPPPAQESRQNG